MIKQNIRIALITILVFIGIWGIACAFIKIDVATSSIINLSNETPVLVIENKNASYIENHDISYVKVEYERQYFNCHILFQSENEKYTNYIINVPEIIPRTMGYMITNVIIDSVNVYQYLFKK